jgi:hypothetical protein
MEHNGRKANTKVRRKLQELGNNCPGGTADGPKEGVPSKEASSQLTEEAYPALPGVKFSDGLEEMMDVGAALKRGKGKTQEGRIRKLACSRGDGSSGSTQGECNGQCGGGVCGSWGSGSHLGNRGTQPSRRGKRRAVCIRQWRRVDVAGCLKTQETGSSQHQVTFMQRVSVILHCVLITTPTTITGIMFYCNYLFQENK